jgi:hypothetical protein
MIEPWDIRFLAALEVQLALAKLTPATQIPRRLHSDLSEGIWDSEDEKARAAKGSYILEVLQYLGS